ncbi:MAG: phosphonate ABC transporter, permease protein PhnE [Roseovarius sp.]|uniref:phosphonate ABC transporter, permease protein PhnE n=1 Tax=Roseovarius sp. TaxID=1486281 RepID=UPI001B455F3F|nr:phosphonate ABC transporter, permease protein PhnE [Roseovarius sp.]MBQ0749541.1 phosphonate ABC transporter, permease protein PhnE [Roseovarius sp.]MBQ0810693.1 phosphonate ABC transporter, permease protein PhnE [Roseovarius sp.]
MSMMTDVLPTRFDATAFFRRKRRLAFAFPAVILAYFVYIFFAFDILGLAERARLDNARILVADSYSYKTHVTRDNRSGALSIAVEGENKGTWPEGRSPDWVDIQSPERTLVTLKHGQEVLIDGNTMRYDVPGYGLIEAEVSRREGIKLSLPTDTIPDWISASDARVDITTDAGRVTLTRARTEVMRYHFGWELFWFTLDSPFYGKSLGELAALAVSSDRIVEGKSNLAAMAHDVWNNRMWQHKDVIWAIFETILMAFLGTMGAGLVALPLAFAAARNFSPYLAVRAAVRRVFDLLRGVDALIWTLVLARAFGPGPMTGALAILLTDTGTFGKLFSEALENVDKNQIEGVQSTGAKPLQRYRFGVIPQITPVLLSQLLYYLESNTRSATVIGAITGGGIGLLLTQAMITQKDWEEVSYYIVLILLMVMLMDTLSGWLRRKLITSDDSGH